MVYALILAGGSGTRFWPLSRRNQPKQFLSLCSGKPMLEQTIERVSDLILKENIYIGTNKLYQGQIRNCLRALKIPAKNIFFEPSSRNTLAPIGVISQHILKRDKEAVIIVMPSDHYVKDHRGFLKALHRAISGAKKGYILTLGVTPVRPETGYGYIEIKPKTKLLSPDVYKVNRLIEKPDLAKAKRLIRSKKYYWNSGIFIFKPDVLLGEISKFCTSDYEVIKKIKSGFSLNRLWTKFTNISIDYAVMEKTKKMALVALNCGWTDLGSWEALCAFAKKDKHGNIFQGNCLDLGSKNILGWTDNRLLATLGLDDVIIVNTQDATLVCAKERSQDVKQIVSLLKQKKLFSKI